VFVYALLSGVKALSCVNIRCCHNSYDINKGKKGKGKCIYIALIFVVHARCSGVDHTVLPAITPVPAFIDWACMNLCQPSVSDSNVTIVVVVVVSGMQLAIA